MSNNGRIGMVVELKDPFYSLQEKLDDFIRVSYVVLLEFGTEAHSSQFP